MKKKIILALTACLFAAGSIIHYNLAENTSRLDVSLADISVMAQADGESDYPYTRPLAYKNGHYCCLNTHETSACSSSVHCDDV